MKRRHSPYTGGLKLLSAFLVVGTAIQWAYAPPAVPISPLVAHVEAQAVETPTPSAVPLPSFVPVPSPAPVSSDPVERYIRSVFGERAEDALKIGRCESGLDPHKIGDKNIISYEGDEIVGDSIGVFQIRTGGKGWNRGRANGMSAEEFRHKLKDYRYNIDYAKKIFDKSGSFGQAWVLCSERTGVK